MYHEAESIKALSALSPLLGYMPGSVGALYQLYQAISPKMPSDLKSTRAEDSPNEDIPAFYFNYDEGHAGRFSVPGTKGASVAFDWVMSQDNPRAFVLRYLTFYDGVERENDQNPVPAADSNAAAEGEEPTAVEGQDVDGVNEEDANGKNDEEGEEGEEESAAMEEEVIDSVVEGDANGKKSGEGEEESAKMEREVTDDVVENNANGNKDEGGEEDSTAKEEETTDGGDDDDRNNNKTLDANKGGVGNVRDGHTTDINGKDRTTKKSEELTGGSNERGEFTVFIPGLNTVHQPREGESTTVDRLRHYVRILDLPMSQVHMGTSFDQGNVKVDPGPGQLIRVLFSSPLIPDSLKAGSSGSAMEWDSRQLDRLQAALSKANAITTPVKDAVRKLVNTAIDAPSAAGPPLVIVGYSRGSIEVEAALRGLIKSRLEDNEDGETTMTKEELEEKLRERVTIVTVGAATNRFPDGPAYVHIAAWTDPLASSSGVTERHDPSGGGRDAVFVNCDSPYHSDAFDNHNFGAITAQYVALILAHNDVHGFRQLWDLAHAGKLRIPPKANELTRALIQLTRGYEWLWNPDAAWKDIPYGALPSREDAINLLRTHMGDKFVDHILQNFPSQD